MMSKIYFRNFYHDFIYTVVIFTSTSCT